MASLPQWERKSPPAQSAYSSGNISLMSAPAAKARPRPVIITQPIVLSAYEKSVIYFNSFRGTVIKHQSLFCQLLSFSCFFKERINWSYLEFVESFGDFEHEAVAKGVQSFWSVQFDEPNTSIGLES